MSGFIILMAMSGLIGVTIWQWWLKMEYITQLRDKEVGE